MFPWWTVLNCSSDFPKTEGYLKAHACHPDSILLPVPKDYGAAEREDLPGLKGPGFGWQHEWGIYQELGCLPCFIFINPSSPPLNPTRNAYYHQLTNEKTIAQPGCSEPYRVICLIQKPMPILLHARGEEVSRQSFCHQVSPPTSLQRRPVPHTQWGTWPCHLSTCNKSMTCFFMLFRILWTS